MFFNIAHAATAENIQDVINIIQGALQSLVPVIVGLAVVVFLWGVLRYVVAGADKEQKEEGRRFIIWGIIGITVMVSLWGLVRFVKNIFFEGTPAPFDEGGDNPRDIGDPNFYDDPGNLDRTPPRL